MPSSENGGDRVIIQTQAIRLHLLREIGTARTPELIRKGEILLYEYSVIMISSIGIRSRTDPMIPFFSDKSELILLAYFGNRKSLYVIVNPTCFTRTTSPCNHI